MAATTTENSGGPMDTVKLALSLLLLVGGIAAFYWYGDQPIYYRAPGLILAVIAAAGLFFVTTQGKTIANYLQGSRTEVRKMVWPTRQETLQTTVTVFIVVVILAIFLWMVDWLLLRGVQFITGMGT